MSIGIHTIGPGYGETIVLELPDGSVGVIDAYRPGKSRFPAAEFLRRRFAGCPLAFLAVTHPHSDHCRGLSQLGDEFSPGEWWAFDAIKEQPILEFLYERKRLGGRDEVDDALGLPHGTIALEILRIHDRVVACARRPSPSRPRMLRAPSLFRLCGGRIRATVLAPNERCCIRYADQVANAVKGITEGQTISPGWTGGDVKPNLISASILLEYGNTSLLFAADTESPVWEEWNADRQADSLRCDKVHFLKVGHHGSINAYSWPLYSALCDQATVAVLTPFSRSRSPLPSREGIQQIAKHTQELFSTNRFVSAESSGYEWEVGPALAVPTGWLADFSRDPSLAGLLSPNFSRSPPPSAADHVPEKWASDCQREPNLVNLLHPNLALVRNLLADLPVEDTFRFSIYFDDAGCEISDKRFCGIGVGRYADRAPAAVPRERA